MRLLFFCALLFYSTCFAAKEEERTFLQIRESYPKPGKYCNSKKPIDSFEEFTVVASDPNTITSEAVKSCLKKLPRIFKKVTRQTPTVLTLGDPLYGIYTTLSCRVIRPTDGVVRFEIHFTEPDKVSDPDIRECFLRVKPTISPTDTTYIHVNAS
jgi:hypothetical protein